MKSVSYHHGKTERNRISSHYVLCMIWWWLNRWMNCVENSILWFWENVRSIDWLNQWFECGCDFIKQRYPGSFYPLNRHECEKSWSFLFGFHTQKSVHRTRYISYMCSIMILERARVCIVLKDHSMIRFDCMNSIWIVNKTCLYPHKDMIIPVPMLLPTKEDSE